MSKELLGPLITSALSVMELYIHDQYKRYNASLKQAQKVCRTMEEVLTGTVRLFNQKKPCLEMKPDLKDFLASLKLEMDRLDDLTIHLPLKILQLKQRHVLRHAEWLRRYLNSHQADNEGEFFLFLFDLSVGEDHHVSNILASMHDRKWRRCSRQLVMSAPVI